MGKLVRVGVVGCGYFAQNHLSAWAAMDDVELAAVCDLDPAKAKAAGSKFGATVYTDAAKMLDEANVDFLDIATTMYSHAALVQLAVERRVPIIVQKPLAPSWEECLAIVERCEKAGVPLMVHENTRFRTPVRKAREVIKSGAIGTVTWARISYRTGYNIYENQPYLAREEKFVLLDLGVHMLDITRFMLGDVSQLYCQTNSVKPGIIGEDMATVMLKHANGATSVVECSYASRIHPEPFPFFTLQIEGTRGSIRMNPGTEMTILSDDVPQTIDVSATLFPWSTPPFHGMQEAVYKTQRHWVESLNTGSVPENSGRDGLKTYGLVFAAYQSAKTQTAMAPFGIVED